MEKATMRWRQDIPVGSRLSMILDSGGEPKVRHSSPHLHVGSVG